jgi:hypothetical protein
MINHLVEVNNRTTTFSGNDYFVEGGIQSDTLTVTFDAEWLEVDDIFCIFTNYADKQPHKVGCTLEDSTATISVPWEAIADSGTCDVSFAGYTGTEVKLITALMASPVPVKQSADDLNAKPSEASPDEFAYLMEVVRSCAEGEAERQATFEKDVESWNTTVSESLEIAENAAQKVKDLTDTLDASTDAANAATANANNAAAATIEATTAANEAAANATSAAAAANQAAQDAKDATSATQTATAETQSATADAKAATEAANGLTAEVEAAIAKSDTAAAGADTAAANANTAADNANAAADKATAAASSASQSAANADVKAQLADTAAANANSAADTAKTSAENADSATTAANAAADKANAAADTALGSVGLDYPTDEELIEYVGE